MHLRAASNGFDMLQTTQSFATGGWGPDESLRRTRSAANWATAWHPLTPASKLPAAPTDTSRSRATCLRVTKDAHYGDSMEQVLYNTILGAWPIQPDGTSFYYADYNNTGKKVWYRDKWPCCSGTFPQLAADYHISTYLRLERWRLREPVYALHRALDATAEENTA